MSSKKTRVGEPKPSPSRTSKQGSNDEIEDEEDRLTIPALPTTCHTISTVDELTDCDRQPLHLLGNVQGGAGHVIFFLRDSYRAVAIDQQILSVPWIVSATGDPRVLLGKMLSECFLSECLKIEGDNEETPLPVAIFKAMREMSENNLDRTFLFVHFQNPQDMLSTYWSISISCSNVAQDESEDSIFSMEIEAIPEGSEGEDTDPQFQDTLVRLASLWHLPETMPSMKDLCATACNQVYELFNGKYDRGMVYEFQDDLSGKVVHEVKSPGLDSSYLGLRYPATDIPKPARELFLKNGLRYNYNIEAVDNPILSISAQNLNLTQIRMRAIHKPHILYLRNMGVISSLAVAIKVQGNLWGLLAFHRYGAVPFKPNLHQRIACETIASMFSTRLERINMDVTADRSRALSQALSRWDKNIGIVENVQALGAHFKEVCDADCIAVHAENDRGDGPKECFVGDESLVPTQAGWERLAKISSENPTAPMITCHTRAAVLQMDFPKPDDFPAAGFCYFRHGTAQVLMARALRSADVAWAGNPDLPKLRIGGILNPRASFDQFMEKAREESRSWSHGDLLVINLLRLRICN